MLNVTLLYTIVDISITNGAINELKTKFLLNFLDQLVN